MNLSQIKSDALAGTPADPPTTIALVKEVERNRDIIKRLRDDLLTRGKFQAVVDGRPDDVVVACGSSIWIELNQALGEDND